MEAKVEICASHYTVRSADENARLSLVLRSIKSRHEEVIEKLNLYLQHAKGKLLRCEIAAEIERREGLVRVTEEKSEKVEKKNDRTKR